MRYNFKLNLKTLTMKKGLTLVLLLALQIITYNVQGQDVFLKNIDEIIITPEDVNVYYEEQIEYYTKKYQALITDLTNTQTSYQLEIEEIESKKKIRKKDLKYISELKPRMMILRKDIKTLKACISMWAGLEIPDNEGFEQLLSAKCYDIKAAEQVYSPEEYSILEVHTDENLSWYELAESIEIEEVEVKIIEPATTKWERRKADRNCVSQDPNDCMVWCLVPVPAVTEKIITKIEKCPLEFENKTNNICVREVSIDNKNKTTERLRIVSTANLTAIHPVSFEEVDCQ